MYSKVEQVSDERPSRRSRWERRAPPPDKTSNKVQCQTGKADIKDLNLHDCNLNPVELLTADTPGMSNDMFMQFRPALYDTIPELEHCNSMV